MKNLKIAAMAAIIAFGLPLSTSIAAQSTANVAVTSNYVFRGFTQSDDGIAVQGGYDIKQSKVDTGWYAGTFASTVDGGTGSGSGLEIDLYGGWKGAFGQNNIMGYDAGAILYKYTDSDFSDDVTEVFAGLSYETAFAKIYFGDVANGGGSYNYLEVGASFVVLNDIDLNLHYGHRSSPSVNDLSASLNKNINGFDLNLGLTYQDFTSTDNIEFFVTVKKDFDL